MDPSTANVLEQFTARTTARLDDAAARLTAVGSDDVGVHESPVAEADLDFDAATAASDPIVRARLTRLGRQLDTLVTAVDDVVRLGAAELEERK